MPCRARNCNRFRSLDRPFRPPPASRREPDLPEAPPRESPDPAGFDGKERHPLAEGLYPWFEGGQSIHWAIIDQADPYLLGPVVVEVVPATAGQDETFIQLDLEFPPLA